MPKLRIGTLETDRKLVQAISIAMCGKVFICNKIKINILQIKFIFKEATKVACTIKHISSTKPVNFIN